jgi:FtsZ-binding cell division protein ZapB
MPRAMRHDLSELPYSPTIWQRIGGPWSITLRAYLWTAPLAIITQPLVEPSFWDDYGTWPSWFLISVLGYLAFGLVLWLGWIAFIDRRNKANSSAALVISIAIIASMFRSATIGLLIEAFGLTGVDSITRLPFGAFLGFAWVFTSALIMDSKYRYQLHLETLVAEQDQLLQQNRDWLGQVRNLLPNFTRVVIEDSHRSLQQAMREIAILSNDPSQVWAKVTPKIKRASIRIALADDKQVWTSEKTVSELQGTRAKALAAITTTPLMNVPLVMTFTATIALLGATRLYSVSFAFAAVAFGIVLHAAIIEFFKFLIKRNYSPSSFRYFLMASILLITSLLSTAIASPLVYDLLVLRTIAFTATIFEIVWLVATGFIQYGQLQRQTTIDSASSENEQLKSSLHFWQQRFVASGGESDRNEPPLLTVSGAMNLAVATGDLELGLEAMEFSNLYFAEFAEDFLGQDDMDIESELGRISRTWKPKAEVIWSVSGARVERSMARRVIASLEVCVSKAIRHGNATVISIDVQRLGNAVEIKASDNGQDYVEGGSGLGVEILMDLTGGTWQRDRSGGLNIATAQFSDQ